MEQFWYVLTQSQSQNWANGTQFTNNITYWQNNYFYHPFQKSISFWKWGGKDIKIFGEGALDGNGQAWYDGFAGLEILASLRAPSATSLSAQINLI